MVLGLSYNRRGIKIKRTRHYVMFYVHSLCCWLLKLVAHRVSSAIYHHHHHHHVPEGLGVFPVPWSSRWSWSLYLFLGRPMFLRPFGLYCSACFGSLSVSILWANQPQQQWRLCRQILLPHPRGLWPRDPWAMQLKLQQTGEGAGESPAP